jgi:Uma2 family endonuclease
MTPPGESAIPSDGLYEIVDGRVVEKVMGTYETGIASLLTRVLGTFANDHRLGQVFGEMLFRIDATKDLQHRPDVAFVSHARWPFQRRAPKGPVWDMVPDLAIEVISQSNSAFEVQKKIHAYFAAGASCVWVIYPEQAEIYIYSSPKQVQVLGSGQQLEGGDLIPGFSFPVTGLFEDDPE